MRPDMKKLLCERPRPHDRWDMGRRPHDKNAKFEDMPLQQSLSRNKYGSKVLNENLAPLRRFIEKQVGRNWDTVYSEICKNIDARDPVQRHILEHIDGYIAINVQKCPLHESATGLVQHYSLITQYDRRIPVNEGDLFVDPKTKIIKRAKRLVPKKKVTKEVSFKKISNTCLAVKKDGIWYSVEVVPFTVKREWKWYSSTDEDDRRSCNINNSQFGHYTNYYEIEGNRYLSKTYGTPYTDITGFFDYQNSMKRVFGSSDLVGKNFKQMNKTQLKSSGLRND